MSSKNLQNKWVVKFKKQNPKGNITAVKLIYQGLLNQSFCDTFANDFAILSEIASEFEFEFVDNITTTCTLTFFEDDINGGYLDALFSLLIAENETKSDTES